MKHTEFLEMANNNTDGSRRRSSGNGMSFGPPPGTGPQRITLRLSGPLPPGQPIPIRFVHGVVPSQPGAAWTQNVAFSSDPIVVELQNQQRERIEQEEEQRKIRSKEAEKKKKLNEERDEKVRKKLVLKPPKIQQKEAGSREGVELSWDKLEVEAPRDLAGEVRYCVQAFVDDKSDAKEIYNGTGNSCVVPSEVLTLGHTHYFGIVACLSSLRGDLSPRCSIAIPAQAPSKPLPPKLSNRGKNNLTLKWNAPSDNGSPITHYDLEWDQCKGQWEKLVSDKAKQFKFVHKFLPASHAQFRVRASNSVGTSEYSDVMSFSSGAGPPSVPKPPTMLEVGIRHLTLAWEAPESNGAEIMSYTLEMEDRDSGYGYRPVYQGDQTAFTCTGLHRVTCYNYRLAASNEKGQSQMSPSVTFKTLPSIPGPPAVPFLKDRPLADSLNIAWQEPHDNGGNDIQTYVLQMSSGLLAGGVASGLVDVYTGPVMAYKADRLMPGKKYETRVCAVSSAGHGQWSPVATFSTPAVVPSAPLSISVVGKALQYALTLQWGCPLSDGGSAITSHAVEMRTSSEADWSVVAIVADPRTFEGTTAPLSTSYPKSISHTIANLLPGTLYSFRVKCRNSVGIGSASVECVGTTAPGQPDSPESLEVLEVTANSAQIKWIASRCRGCTVDSYEVQCVEEGMSTGTHTSSITNTSSIQKLSPATCYQTRVKAWSSVGDSDWSVPATFTTGNAPPAPPSHLDLITFGPSSLLIGWNIPNDNGSPVTVYYVEVGLEVGHMSSRVDRVETVETQYTITDLRPNTTYKFRVQAENGIGRGGFSVYKTGTTLPPPPSPPHLSLGSCSANMLKVVWGRKTSRHVTFVLQLASPGNQFYEVYQGSAVSHRVSRLQPSTDYTLRIAAVSDSGQGEWSDAIVFSTTPTPPDTLTGVVLKQADSRTLRLEWDDGFYTQTLTYEAQYRPINSNQEFQQCYKGSQNYTEIFLTPPSPSNGTSSGRSTTTLVYEARVRSCATCMVNGRKEQLWSPYSNSAVCRWEEAAKKVESPEAELSSDKTQEVSSKGFFSGWSAGVLVFILVTLLTVVLAIGLGQVIVV